MKNKIFLTFTLITFFSIFLFQSCVTSSNLKNTAKTENLTSEFYLNYQNNTTKKKLSNGINVVINNNFNAKVNTVSFYFKTGSSILDIDKTGVANITLNLMTMESKNFSQENKERLLNSKQANFFYTVGSSFSSVTITSLTKYFNQIFPIMKDAILNPNFSNFSEIIKNEKFYLQNTTQKDNQLLTKLANEKLRNDTDFLGKNNLILENLDNITKEDLENFYNQFFTQDSIYILCAGNFDVKNFMKDLEKTFGNIKLLKKKTQTKFNYEFKTSYTEFNSNDNPKLDFAKSFRNFCSADDELFASSYIAILMYSDLLYNIVREKYGSCYSVYSYLSLCDLPFFTTEGYRISNKENFSKA